MTTPATAPTPAPPPTPLERLGNLLRGLRAMRSLSQGDVAAAVTAAGTPLTAAALGTIEGGKTPGPRVELLWALLAVYRIDAELAWNVIVGVPD